MTRILPASGANLAHYFPKRENHRSGARCERLNDAKETRHFGNRRMGDRRGDGRTGGGRRKSDRMARQAGPGWISASISAHLIGQSLPSAPTASQAQQAYTAHTRVPGRRGGGLV